jgi:signal transduction histidine kinase
MDLSKKVWFVALIMAFLIVLVTVIAHIVLSRQDLSANADRIDAIAAEYSMLFTQSQTFSSSQTIRYGAQFMTRYSIYNTTLTDFVDLSGVQPFSEKSIFNGMRLFYNVSGTDANKYEQRMSELLDKQIVFTDLNLDGTQTPVKYRDYYCPIFFVTPRNPTSYLPGVDFCNIDTTKPLMHKLIDTKTGSFVIQPRKGVLVNATLLDVAVKVPQGFAVLILNVDNAVNSIVKPTEKVQLADLENKVFYDNCQPVSCDKSFMVSKPITLSNGDELYLSVYFLPPPGNLYFLVVLGGMLIVGFLVVSVVFYFEEQNKKFVVANKMLGYVNHELRNPLNCINGLIEVCMMDLEERDKNLYAETLSNLGTAKNACNLMEHVMNDILDLERIKDGKLIIVMGNIQLDKFLANLRKIIEPKITERPSIECTFSNPDNITWVYTDYNRLLQILLNFLSNAIKFTLTGHIDLLVQKDGEYVKFSVSDTGRGIEKDKFADVFKPFEQINLYDNLRQGGIGLGLYLCKLMTDRLGGEIGFESKIKVGSTFWIKLKCLPDVLPTNLIIKVDPTPVKVYNDVSV